MNNKVAKTAAIAGSAVLVGASAFAVAPAIANGTAPTGSPAIQEASASTTRSHTVSVASVEGAFSYDQNTVTPNDTIASMFRKAAEAVCSSLPNYSFDGAPSIAVGGSSAENSFSATVGDIASSEDAASFILACACAANGAGGGAIANAEVEGVALETIARMAGAE